MKTLDNHLDDKAKELGYSNWNEVNTLSHLVIVRDKIISSAALEYVEAESKAFAEFLHQEYWGWYAPDQLSGIKQTTTELYKSEEFKKFRENK